MLFQKITKIRNQYHNILINNCFEPVLLNNNNVVCALRKMYFCRLYIFGTSTQNTQDVG